MVFLNVHWVLTLHLCTMCPKMGAKTSELWEIFVHWTNLSWNIHIKYHAFSSFNIRWKMQNIFQRLILNRVLIKSPWQRKNTKNGYLHAFEWCSLHSMLLWFTLQSSKHATFTWLVDLWPWQPTRVRRWFPCFLGNAGRARITPLAIVSNVKISWS